MKTVGETLIDLLKAKGTDLVFGIPGVHTVELYRGLGNSSIRHITPRHEQSAGFMADGYTRVSGKPGVCLIITGPGLTNMITPMAQAMADSIPMFVISGVNKSTAHGHYRGALHELPDQQAMMSTVTKYSQTLLHSDQLGEVFEKAWTLMLEGRPGPVHIEIPIDVMSQKINAPRFRSPARGEFAAPDEAIEEIAKDCAAAQYPVILIGGGAKEANDEISELATRLDAPVISTINARGMLANHDLLVPASPGLESVRACLRDADLILAFGTQMGATDYDIYENNGTPELQKFVRIDKEISQLVTGPANDLAIVCDAKTVCKAILAKLDPQPMARNGKETAERINEAVLEEIGPKLRHEIDIIHSVQLALPNLIFVGDSTQLVYAGNCFCRINRVSGWFNSSVGYGSLGYGIPAAIGASLADPKSPVVCIVGDGGAQFTLSELGSAMDEETPVIFLVWNNSGYQEIARFMETNNITTVGVTPSAPDFVMQAKSYGMDGIRLSALNQLADVLKAAYQARKPYLIEMPESVCGYLD
ncbi:MAG: 5-guanidino-2-oxopentanoate decarboxylase [Pseudomonadota bacterium]